MVYSRIRQYIRERRERPPKSSRSPLQDRLPEEKDELRKLMVQGRVREAAILLGRSPELASFFVEMLTGSSLYHRQALPVLAKVAADEKTGDSTVKLLAQMLDHDNLAVRKLATNALRVAVMNENADILSAVPALERHVSEPGLAMEATTALTLHYLKNHDEEGMMGLLRNHGKMVMEWAASILCKETAAGDTFALPILIEGYLDENQAVRKCSAEKLAFSLFKADEKTRELINSTIREAIASNPIVPLDARRVFADTKRLMGIRGGHG